MRGGIWGCEFVSLRLCVFVVYCGSAGCHCWLAQQCDKHCWTSQQWHPVEFLPFQRLRELKCEG
jgi:hypothetical protein